jgi:hypothetical protein
MTFVVVHFVNIIVNEKVVISHTTVDQMKYSLFKSDKYSLKPFGPVSKVIAELYEKVEEAIAGIDFL